MNSVMSPHLFKTTQISSEKICFRSEAYSLSKKLNEMRKSKPSNLSWLVNEKSNYFKSNLNQGLKRTSSSRGAYLWNSSIAGAFWMARREVWPRCCKTQQAGLRFAGPLSEDELSSETEVGPMVQKRRASNHFICNYKHPPAPSKLLLSLLPSQSQIQQHTWVYV